MQRRSTTAPRCAALHRSLAARARRAARPSTRPGTRTRTARDTEIDLPAEIDPPARVDPPLDLAPLDLAPLLDLDRPTDIDAPDLTMFAIGSGPAPALPPAGTLRGPPPFGPDAPPVAPGAVVGNYRVVRPLAQGGMGVVFLGQHLRLGRTVALKFLHRRLANDLDATQRFFAEAVATARLTHPGVVSLFDYGEHDGHAYLVMEYLAGESLSARLARGGRLPPARAIDIGVQLAETLAAAHAAGVVHRDLKPDNIHLVPDPAGSGPGHVKVLDFGVAKLMQAPGDPTYTRRGDVLGTPFYMAPEQCANAGAADARSDVYSLGCVLFHLLTGIVPFDGPTIIDVLMAHQSRRLAPPRHFVPDLPPALDRLVVRMLAKDPAQRPSDMSQVAAELRSIASSLAALPPSTRAPRLRAITSPGPRRRALLRVMPLGLATLALAAIALAFALGHIRGAW